MSQFLSLLKHRSQRSHVEPNGSSAFFFLIGKDEEGCYVETVDKQQQPVHPNYAYFQGYIAQTLRSIDHLKEEQVLQIRWDRGQVGERLYMTDCPYLVPQLLLCPNLVNEEMRPIQVSNETATLRLVLANLKQQIDPILVIDQLPDAKSDAIHWLTDSHILVEDRIFPILPVGENYDQMPVFLKSFDQTMLEKYLSVFYSYMDNIEVNYEDCTIQKSETPITLQPTLIFQKVDSDQTLHLRMTASLPDCDLEFLEDFDLTWKATQMPDQRIVLQRIQRESLSKPIETLRKAILQQAPNRAAQREVYQEDNFFMVPPDIAGPFLIKELPALLQQYRVLGADQLRAYQIKAVRPKMNINLSSGIDFLEGDLSLDLDGESFSLGQLLKQYRKQRYVVLSDGNRALLDEGYIRRLERVFQSKKGNKIRVSFFDLPEVEQLQQQRLEGEAFTHHREVFDGFNQLKDQKLKLPKVQAELRSYQKEGVKWMRYLYDNKLGGCLADDMGLGKTLQTITVLASIYPKVKRSTLIVMPRSLLFNWESELARFAPQLSVYTYYGTTRDFSEAKKHQLILTTYAIVRNDIELLSKESFHYVILDESQNIKNTGAQITQSVLLLQAEHRLALSGTPIENNLTELYSLFRFLNPAMFGSLEDFNTRYTYPIQKDNDKETMESLRRKIYPFLLRRLKRDVLKELPDRTDKRLYVEMNEEQARFYEQRRAYYYQQVKQTIAAEGVQKSQFVMFQALNELRRIASIPESLSEGRITSPKIEVLMDTLLEAISNNHKVVIFFNYIAGIELIGDKLNESGISFACMTGSTHDRKSVVERFQTDPNCKALLMTLKTGGVGLNLTAADTVFIFEPWWNKAAEEQAINRLHRFGQTAKVLCYSILTQGSIEEKICLLQQQKAELFEQLIGSDNGSIKQLSEEDINYILG